MADDFDFIEKFVEGLSSPKRVKTDAGEVEQHSLSDLIKALEYLKKNDLEKKGRSPLSRLGFYQIVNKRD